MPRLCLTSVFQRQSVCSSAATLIIEFRVVLLSFSTCCRYKYTFAACLDLIAGVMWLNFNMTTFYCSQSSLSSLSSVNIDDLTALLYEIL